MQSDVLLSISTDLTTALTAEDRYHRLLTALHNIIPYDSAALMRLEGAELLIVVSKGLRPEALSRKFALRDHPRLDIICKSKQPVLFPTDTDLPDPFDNLLAGFPEMQQVHACLGIPLYVENQLMGALAADAAKPNAFEQIDVQFLKTVGALAAAEMRTTALIQSLERTAERQGIIARDLMRDTLMRQGSQILGISGAIERLRREISLVAKSDYSVLITGETGVGKELVARAIHIESHRGGEPLIYVNCAALPETLADSELFGHEKGAFTGAATKRPGKFEVADRGTLFLDEVGELPLTIQPKLLRALQEGEIQRVGSDKPSKVDVRVLAATNRNLEHEVRTGRFRADLFHRLNVYPLHVPPLRDRKEDIPLLAGYFCDLSRQRLGTGPIHLDSSAVESLISYDWPGNIRELENVISRVALKAAHFKTHGNRISITAANLAQELAGELALPRKTTPTYAKHSTQGKTLKEAAREFQLAYITQTLNEHGGNFSKAAKALGLHRSNFHHLASRLGIKKR